MLDGHGSDVPIDVLGQLGIKYAVVNPGASFRGMHASLVHAGRPELVLALQENVAVSIGHGYAKSSGGPLAVFLHNLVGLQSGAMGIFNAWADQVPILIFGGSGPADTTKRRPWLDWVHSCRTQALVVRDYVKWDDQPVSIEAMASSVVRAHRLATAVPAGPTYVAVDADLQEQRLTDAQSESIQADIAALTGGIGAEPTVTVPDHHLEELAQLLAEAENPVIVTDYTGKSRSAYEALIDLASTLAAPVVDLMARHNFPNDHWADCTRVRDKAMADADVVLCLDVRDLNFGLAATVHESHGFRRLVPAEARVVSISMNRFMQSGFMDYSPIVGGVTELTGDTGACLPVLAGMVKELVHDRSDRKDRLSRLTAESRRDLRASAEPSPIAESGLPTVDTVSAAVYRAVADGPWELANGHLRGSVRRRWLLNRFNAHLGQNVGAGLGYGIGVAVGAALAHRGDETTIVNLQNDGDLMYTPAGLWTAAHYQLPILTVVINNRTYGQDRMHQSIIAKDRGYSLDDATVGIDIDDPAIDFAMMARSQGMEAWGPVTDVSQLGSTLAQAVKAVREDRRPALVDVVVPRA